MKLGVLFSGGKDSLFACWKAMQHEEVACLVTVISQNPESYMFHTPNIHLAGLQAEAAGLPLVEMETAGEKEAELLDLKRALLEAMDRFGIEGSSPGRSSRSTRRHGSSGSAVNWTSGASTPLACEPGDLHGGTHQFRIPRHHRGCLLLPFRCILARKGDRPPHPRRTPKSRQKYQITLTGEGESLRPLSSTLPSSPGGSRSRRYQGFTRTTTAFSGSNGWAGREMILVIDLCYRDGSLSRDEFVGPVMRTLQEAGAQFAVRHYAAVSAPDLEAANAVILCGTALKDTGFMEHPGRFGWLAVFERPVLGISSGMLTLAGAFGGVAEPCPGIGMTDVRVIAPDPLFDGRETFAAYELHEFAVQVPGGSYRSPSQTGASRRSVTARSCSTVSSSILRSGASGSSSGSSGWQSRP